MKNSLFFTIVFCRKIQIFESYDQFDPGDTSSAVLQIPPVIKCRQRRLCDGLEGLCVLLRRTSYPCRCSDMIPRFPRPVSVLSLITNEVLGHRLERKCSKPSGSSDICRSNIEKRVTTTKLLRLYKWICSANSRPDTGQRVVYNGHTRVHGLKSQSVTQPDGLIGNIFGSVAEHFIYIVLSNT